MGINSGAHFGRTLAAVNHAVIPVIPLAATATPAATTPCGHCLHSSAGPVCQVEPSAAPGEARLEGPPEELATVMQALDHDLSLVRHHDQSALPLSRSGLVRSLSLSADEVMLVLAVAPRCGGAQLAETAFQTLRRLRPDTDIYVTHATA